MNIRNTTLASITALALSACAVGPDFVAPTPRPAESGPFLSAANPAFTPAPLPADWWRMYDDPVLDGLVVDAQAANTDIRQAVARIARARAALRGAGADRLPSTQVGASATYNRIPEIQTLPGLDREQWSVDAGLDVAYEVDLFGRVSRGVEAARADLAAADADADAVRVMVVAETTRAYADAAGAAARIAVARDIVDLLDQSLALTQRRYDEGFETGLAVARIATLREQRAAEIPALEAIRAGALFRLATLTGRAPAELPPIAGERSVVLEITQALPVGDGAELLARRPDIRAAERRVAADTARIGVATADLYPRIALGAQIGSTGPDIGDIFTGGPLRWLLGPLLSWSFPNNEAVRARIDAAEADTQERLAAFDGTVLTALQETETALATYAGAIDRRRALQQATAQAERAATIVRAQQREGRINSLDRLDAERTLAETRASLAAQDALVSTAQIDLFRALGGGWSDTSGASESLRPPPSECQVPAMQPHIRAMIAAATFASVTGKKVAGVHDHTAGLDLRIAAECRGDQLQGFDGDRGVSFGGTFPEIYHEGEKAFVSFERDGGKVTGYDRQSTTFYTAQMTGDLVQVYDHGAAAWYSYDMQDPQSDRSYHRAAG